MTVHTTCIGHPAPRLPKNRIDSLFCALCSDGTSAAIRSRTGDAPSSGSDDCECLACLLESDDMGDVRRELDSQSATSDVGRWEEARSQHERGQQREHERSRQARLVVVAGARGGVGKSIVAANLALYLATIGRRVVAVDVAPTGGNLHTCIGAKASARWWAAQGGLDEHDEQDDGAAAQPRAATVGGVESSSDRLYATPYQGLQLLLWRTTRSGFAGELDARVAALRELSADYIVLDLGVSFAAEYLDAYLAADLSVFVLAPEPTAVENTYRFLRATCCQLLRRNEWSDEQRAALEACPGFSTDTVAPQDLLASLQDVRPEMVEAVQRIARTFRPRLVVNQTRLRSDLLLGPAMVSVARRRLSVQADYLGHIDHDDVMWSCVRNCKPVLLEVPGAKCSKKIERLARRLLTIDAGKEPSRVEWDAPEGSHHELLELSRGATDEEVRRAFKRAREIYAHDALCCYGALEGDEIERIRVQLDEALDVLLDPARRRPYELSVFPDDLGPSYPDAEEMALEEPAEPMPELSPDTQFTGALLRKVREAKRIPLRDISERTKVGLGYLKAIELEDFGALPAPVYTSGFVTEIARFLRLDPRQVSRTYVRRYRRYLEERQAAMVQQRS